MVLNQEMWVVAVGVMGGHLYTFHIYFWGSNSNVPTLLKGHIECLTETTQIFSIYISKVKKILMNDLESVIEMWKCNAELWFTTNFRIYTLFEKNIIQKLLWKSDMDWLGIHESPWGLGWKFVF